VSMPCPCAQCASCQDPRVVSNPPGLAQVSYRADDFAGFRRALLRHLPQEQAIAAWQPAPGDLGLQVLEWWAYLGDVLTFYNERIANESYLRTAVLPSSVANLVALLGYNPTPGIAATGTVAAMRSAARPAEPVVIPAGMRMSSTVTPGVAAQTFEASAAASFTGPSSVPVTLPPAPATVTVTSGDPAAVLLAGPVSGIKAGDQLLLAGSSFAGADDGWSLVTVQALTPQPDPGTGRVNTLIALTSAGWGPAGQASTPDTTAGYRLLRPAATAALWTQTASGPPPSGSTGTTPVVGGSPLHVRLAATVRVIVPGDIVLFTAGPGTATALAVVAAVGEEFWPVPYPDATPPVIPVAHTVLTLTLADPDATALKNAASSNVAAITMWYGWRDLGTAIGAPAASLSSLPATVRVPSSYTPSGTTTAIVTDANGAGVLVNVTPAGAGQVTLTGPGTPPAQVAASLAVPLQLLVDLVPVSRGTTVANEVLGSGNAALINQSFTLAKSPLTYLAIGAGAIAELAVYVDGVQWHEVPSFYGQQPGAHVFVVSRSADQTVTTVTFGDGANGGRLPTGSGNVTATYRYGSGLASPPAGRLTTISQPQPNLAAVQNPVAVSGGADPQAVEDTRGNAPASVFAFGRAISAADYEVVAAHAPGVRRAAARWVFDGGQQRTLVAVYVGDDPAAVSAARAAVAGSADPNRPVAVAGATEIPLTLSCTLLVAADRQADAVVAAATAAVADPVAGLFSPARMGIGQRLYRSAVDAALMVDGAVAVRDLAVNAPIGRIFTDAIASEFADPGEDGYFTLPPGQATITGVSASA
jgi:Baseplate J-like protein